MRKAKELIITVVCILSVLGGMLLPVVPVRASGEITYVLNTNSKKFHLPECESVSLMSRQNRRDTTMSYDEVIEAGYVPCKNCHPDQAAPRASTGTSSTTVRSSGTSGNGTSSSANNARTVRSSTTAAADRASQTEITYVLNTNTKKFHRPSCSSVSTIKSQNRKDTSMSYDEVIAAGYSPCGRCHPN